MKLVRGSAYALLLALFWLLLVNELSLAQAVLGLLLGAAVAAATYAAVAGLPPLRRPIVALRLLAVFAYDIAVANLAVARAALSPRLPIRPRFVRVPLDVREPVPAALLAGMVTLTPGTVSVDLDLDAGVLVVHGLLVDDEARMAAGIKTRYEARLKEIFAC
jgi:multicomponent K+:H+ antiporter subunit E